MIRLTAEQVQMLHEDLIRATGGLDGVRDYWIPHSACLFRPLTVKRFTHQQKAARLCFSLVKNHPFVDGNKRIGVHAMLVFLALNGVGLGCRQSELVSLGLSLAAGGVSCDGVLQWIVAHQR